MLFYQDPLQKNMIFIFYVGKVLSKNDQRNSFLPSSGQPKKKFTGYRNLQFPELSWIFICITR